MNINKFYNLDEKLSSATLQAHSISLKNIENDIKNLLKGNYNDICFPVVFKQVYGKRLDDIIRTGTGLLFLMSDRMKTVLEENKLTGWKAFPVKVLDKKDNEIKGYHGFSILGRCGPIDYSKCEIIEKRLVPTGPLGKYYKGLYVGLDQWDGSDFFLPEGTFHIIASQNAANIIKKNKLTNVVFENLADIETPDFALKKWKKSQSTQ